MEKAMVIVRILLVSVAVAASSYVCEAQTIADAVSRGPEALKFARLDMSLEEARGHVPKATFLGSPNEPTSLLMLTPGADWGPWDGAMLEFKSNKLAGINLLVGTSVQTNTLERTSRVLADVIAYNGIGYERAITLNSSKQPIPTLVWQKATSEVFVIGPSLGIANAGGQVIPADPRLRVGVTYRNRPIGEVGQSAAIADLVDFLFRALAVKP